MTAKMESIDKEMINIFIQASTTSASHKKGILQLQKLIEMADVESFYELITRRWSSVMILTPPNSYAEKCTSFIAEFFASLKGEQENDNEETEDVRHHPILIKFFELLLQLNCCVNNDVRYWTCELLTKILNCLTFLNEKMCDDLEEAMLERLDDPKVAIRLQAVECLRRLQNPGDVKNVIVKKYLSLMDTDNSAKIRKKCIEVIGLRDKDVIPALILHTRDVDESVRLAAFKKLSKIPKYLYVEDKRLILNNGFLNSRNLMEYFLFEWLNYYKGDILNLLKELQKDLSKDNFEDIVKTIEMVLKQLFEQLPISDNIETIRNLLTDWKLIDFENLNKETSIFWRVLIQFLFKQNNEIVDECLRPELIVFCKYIEKFLEFNNNDTNNVDFEYILNELFQITQSYDVDEMVGRNQLNATISKIFEQRTFTKMVMRNIFRNLERTISSFDSRCLFVDEIIQNLKMPFNEQNCGDIDKLKTELLELNEQKKKAVQAQDYNEAENLRNEIKNLEELLAENEIKALDEEEENEEVEVVIKDTKFLLKCLNLIEALLKSSCLIKFNGQLKLFLDRYIIPNLVHTDEFVVRQAFICYALCCNLNEPLAKNGIHILCKPIFCYQSGEECSIDILIECMKAIVNLLRVHGGGLVTEPIENLSETQNEEHIKTYEGGTSLTDIVQGLVDLMNDENNEIQFEAVRGLCLLLLGHHVHSENLLSVLIVKWFSPATSCEKLKCWIGLTLDHLSKDPTYGNYLEKSVLFTLQVVAKAPDNSPLRDINFDNLIKFLTTMCKRTPQAYLTNRNVAFEIYNAMSKKPKSKINYLYSKVLLLLLTPEDSPAAKELFKLFHELRNIVNDKQVKNNLSKYLMRLEKDCKSSCEEEQVEEEEEEEEGQVGEEKQTNPENEE